MNTEHSQMEQLKLLMDYTIFHIGVYITLSGLMVSLLGLKAFANRAKAMRCYILGALTCFLIAGMCGGLIAGNIPYFSSFTAFTDATIGPWFTPPFLRASYCMNAEHTAFWAGVTVFLFGFWRSRK